MNRIFILWGFFAAVSILAETAQTSHDHHVSIEESKSLIGLTIKHRPDFHCANGSERAFLVNVSERHPDLVPILPELAGPLSGPYPYPLMLDSTKRKEFSGSGEQSAATSFARWLDGRRSVLVSRSSPFGRAPDDCNRVNGLANVDVYTIPLATPSAASSPTKAARNQGAKSDNEGLQPLKSPAGSQVGWIFRSTRELWAIDMKGEHASKIDTTGIHGCSLSPTAPIFACEDPGQVKEANILGVKIKVLRGSYWYAKWSPDGSGFLTREKIEDDPNLTIYYRRVSSGSAVVGQPVSMVPSGWTPSGCCTGDFFHYDPIVKKYCPSMNREGFTKRSYTYEWNKAAGCPGEGLDPRAVNSGWPWGSEPFAWSPNARWIYYSATTPGKGRTILKVPIRDPRHFEPVTDGIVRDAVDPVISPDGKQLAFLSQGPQSKPEPGRCPQESTEEFNVQLYTVCDGCEHRKESLRQKTHLGCNTMIGYMIWR